MKYCTSKYGQDVLDRNATVGDSQSNGRAEVGVREVKCKIRTFAQAASDAMKITFDEKDPALHWLIGFAAASISIGRRGADGFTAYKRRYHHDFRKALPCWGERIMYNPVGKHPARLVSRNQLGIMLGVSIRSGDRHCWHRKWGCHRSNVS